MSFCDPDPDHFVVDTGYRDPFDERDDIPEDDGPDRPMTEGRKRWLSTLGRWVGEGA